MAELSYHIIDLVENSVTAGASEIRVLVENSPQKNRLAIRVEDNGTGIPPQHVDQVQNPFYTSKKGKRVGLGIPLLKETALHCGGDFSLKSVLGKGTTIQAEMKFDHIDRPPMGDMNATILTLISSDRDTNLVFTYRTDRGEFSLSVNDIREQIGDAIHLSHPKVIRFLEAYIDNKLSELNPSD